MTENSNGGACLWCARSFGPRRGGSPQRFCGARCRSAFWSALRRWGERAVAAGIVTIDDVRNGDGAACTLVRGATSPALVGWVRSPHPAPVAPRGANGYTSQQNLELAMARAMALRRRG